MYINIVNAMDMSSAKTHVFTQSSEYYTIQVYD